MKIDLDAVPFVDGHMHAPLAARPATPEEYAWPWYEGNASTSRWRPSWCRSGGPCGRWASGWAASRRSPRSSPRIGARLAMPTGARSASSAATSAAWCSTPGYPPPDVVVPHTELAKQVPVAWLVRIEVEAQRLLAEATSLEDWLERVDAASDAGLDAGAAGLKSIIALPLGPRRLAGRHGRRARRVRPRGGRGAVGRGGAPVGASRSNDLLVLRALDVCRRRGVSLQLHAGYGDRDIDLRLGSPFGFRWALESGAADGVEVVFLHASWPHIRDAARDGGDPPPRLRRHRHVHPADRPRGRCIECWREALTVAPITRIHASSDAAGVFEQSRSAPSAPATRSASRSASSSPPASCRGPRPSAPGELILGGNSRRLYGLE